MWLPNPPGGTSVCGGFDGSDTDDWTVIKLETRDRLIFTPRYGADRRPTIWNPVDWGGRIPRGEVHAAWAEIVDTYDLRRAYYDPGFHDETSWESEGEEWALEWGEERFVPFPTTSGPRMYSAIRRLEADLPVITQDGCPITLAHMRNARKIMSRGGRMYTLGKPAHHQKIDAAVTVVITHEAAADERAAGWPEMAGPTVLRLAR
jgi:hypothetical protein